MSAAARSAPAGRASRALRAARALCAAAAVFLAAPCEALVGDWLSFTNVSEVHDLEYFQGELYAATSGGIRRVDVDSREEFHYNNTHGLVDVYIQSLAATPEGELWAASRSGVLYRLSKDRTRWEAQGLSYRSAGWEMKRRAMIYRSPYLILGSTEGLSFYNTRKGVADANITRMGSAVTISVNGLAMVGDTLFAGTGKGIYRATLDLDSLMTSKAVNIYNPAIWTLVPRTAGARYYRPAEPDTALPDTLLPADAGVDSAHGLVYYGGDGVASEYEGDWDGADARVSRYGNLWIKGEEHVNPSLGEGRGWIETVKMVGERVFVGDSIALYEFDRPSGRLIAYVPKRELPRREITMVAATGGKIYAFGMPYIYTLEDGVWQPMLEPFLPSAQVDANRAGSHPLHVVDKDRIYFGSWGSGFFDWEDGRLRSFTSGPDGGSCLETAVTDVPYYAVVRSLAPYRRQGIWLSTFHQATNYKLAYYDIGAKRIHCFDVDSRSQYANSLEVIHDSLLVAVTEKGVDVWRIRESDGSVSLDPQNRTPLLRAGEPTRIGLSDREGNYWVTTDGGRMYYLPRFGPDKLDSAGFQTFEGFPGRECKSLSRDGRGHIWVGCFVGGLVEITPSRDSLRHAYRRYGINDGLLSETVYHVSADTTNGHVWVVTDRGLARYESASRTVAAKLKEARVFPNPFLARHSHVIFDGLSSGSRLQILTQGGSVVYSRSLAAEDGHQLRWDGRNQSGSRVREGVYFYVISTGGHVARGKLIVAR